MPDSAVEKALKHPNKLGAGAEKRKHLKPHERFQAVMEEFARGTLHSGSGEIVKNRQQALAIAESESRNDQARFDNGTIESYVDFTEEGYLKADAVVTRTGVFFYKNLDGTIRRELRHPEDVTQEESLKTIKLIPVTNDHPPERLVDAENAKRLSVGYTGENVRIDGNFIFSNFLVTDKNTIDEIVKNGKRQLSLGYTVDLVPEKGVYDGEEYDFRQTNIRYNHLSIVQNARAGAEAKIALDSYDAIELTNKREVLKMAKRKVKIDEEEFMMEPEVAEPVEKLLEDLKNLEEEKSRVEEELSMIKDKLEKSLAERDAAKEEAKALLGENEQMKEEKTDSVEINRRVKERFKLMKLAEIFIPSENFDELEKLSEIEIKKQIIKAKSKTANLDGKSDIYINARFDAIIEDMPKNLVVIGKRKVVSNDSQNRAEAARNKMIHEMINKS